tara:strand:- start:4900 stop:6684 length:1785 start_codon:yes stop_codon:yes gene_type:complete
VCGFIGKIAFDKVDEKKLSTCNKNIICRGPDSTNHLNLKSNEINYSFIFNRLSILDLSAQANQPMLSENGDHILMFNGEIYNHKELRRYLNSNGINFTTSHSDTEVVLRGLMYEGSAFINKLRGMFSIFYLDRYKKEGLIIRDRLGQKPIYYKKTSSSLSFSSNLISLIKIDNNYKIDEHQLLNYLNFGIISSPDTLFKHYKKLQPGSFIKFNYSDGIFSEKLTNYWKTEDYVDSIKFNKGHFFKIFEESVNLRNMADVPIANFLSGGIDSTSIVKSLHDSGQEVNTFSVNNNNNKYDESHWSDMVAKKYSTNHKSINMSSSVDISDIEFALASLDEPYSDPSLIPSYLLSKYISSEYKVAISGDGGDELLGGYERIASSLKKRNSLKNTFSNLYKIYPPFLGTGSIFLSNSGDYTTSYRSYLEDRKLLKLLKIKSQIKELNIPSDEGSNSYKSLMQAEYKFYLSEMMMFKIDRTSMSNSLEIRSPFVDHKLVEYILSCDINYVDMNRPKKILKDFLLGDFDNSFVDRQKKGFIFDLENWVYQNKDIVFDTIKSGVIGENYKINNINKLNINKSRINANRLWKMYVLEKYISNL